MTLWEAIEKGDMIPVKKLIDAGADINEIDEKSRTPLMLALQKNHTSIAILLAKSGCDVNALDEDGQNALFYTSTGYQARCLITAKIDLFCVNKKGEKPQSALNAAFLDKACLNGIRATKALIAAGADIHARTKQGETALERAVRNGHDKIVDILVAAGIDVNMRGKEQQLKALTQVPKIIHVFSCKVYGLRKYKNKLKGDDEL